MKIDLGPNSKILGTKRVSGKGQISGFTEYAGREVMIILPSKSTDIMEPGANDVYTQLHDAVIRHMELAVKRNKDLLNIFGSTGEAAEEFLKTITPTYLSNLRDELDKWIKRFTE